MEKSDLIKKIKEDFGSKGFASVRKTRQNHIFFTPREGNGFSSRAFDTKTDDPLKAYLVIANWVRDGFPKPRQQKKEIYGFADFCAKYWQENPENRRTTKMHALASISWVERHVKPYFGDMKINVITPKEIRKFLNSLRTVENAKYKRFKEKYGADAEYNANKYLAPGTIKGIRNSICLPLQYAAQMELISDSVDWLVVCRIKSAKGKDDYFKSMVRPRDIFEPEELCLLDTAEWPNVEAQMCYKLIRHTGMRYGEARGLKIGKVLSDRIIIDTGYNDVDEEKETKTGQYREVPIPQWLYLEVRNYVASFPLDEMKQSDCWLFPSSKDFSRPIDSSFLAKKLDEVMKKLNIPKVRRVRGVLRTRSVHSLRHCKDMELMAAGLTIKQISDTIGHSAAMVAHYTDHYSASDFDAVAEKMKAAGLMDNPNERKENAVVLKMAASA